MKNKKVIGLDLSLCKTGWAILEGKTILDIGIIKSAPDGDRPIEEYWRLDNIVFEIGKIVDKYSPKIAVIENLAFLAKGTSLTQLAGLSYFVRKLLIGENIPFYLVAPTTLKRFATGSGKGEKDHMLLNAYKEFGIEGIDNNEADAAFLALLGSMIIGTTKPEFKYQEETLELIKKQNE